MGRGRIVASAFRLSSLDLIDWPGWDGVLNGCLLRRPQRDFRLDPDPNKTEGVHWADTRAHPDPWDPALSSRLRFFARDAAVVPASHVAKAQQGNRFGNVPNGGQVYPTQGDDPSEGDDGSGETFAPVGTGVAAWNDFNPVANAARQGLQQAAGIKVLDRMFVVWIVACYVLVLVPLNWGVFRLLGRVEWAWAAAPLIAVACAAVVINVAKLDIGFVRSENEIAVVELQGDYPRGARHPLRGLVYLALHRLRLPLREPRLDDAAVSHRRRPGQVPHVAGGELSQPDLPPRRRPRSGRLRGGLQLHRLHPRRTVDQPRSPPGADQAGRRGLADRQPDAAHPPRRGRNQENGRGRSANRLAGHHRRRRHGVGEVRPGIALPVRRRPLEAPAPTSRRRPVPASSPAS